MTTPEPFTPESFLHLPTAVQAMQVRTVKDAHVAYGWLVAHNVGAAIRLGHRHGHIVASSGGAELSISLGQWLVYCPATGHFTAYDDDEFRRLHRRAEAVA